MKLTSSLLQGCFIVNPLKYDDDRGFIFESFNQKEFNHIVGNNWQFVQENHSLSRKGVLRGLHYQRHQAQGKLIRILHGEILDVAIDLRKSSATFGKVQSLILNASSGQQLWIPPGLAHGYVVRSESAEVIYKNTDYYSPENECCIVWNDRDLNVDWDLTIDPILSEKDRQGVRFRDADLFD